MIDIIEIKAKCANPEFIRNYLKRKDAQFKGLDHQIDTYFNCNQGRLKLRQGNVETTLIQYNRSNQAGPKNSQVTLFKPSANADQLREVLSASMGVKVVVDKHREIYFIENVKFHIDEVKGLGSFMEIEAIDENGDIPKEKLLGQCQYYLKEFEIKAKDLIEVSYSDLILAKG